jgi:hypothetical protein
LLAAADTAAAAVAAVTVAVAPFGIAIDAKQSARGLARISGPISPTPLPTLTPSPSP